MIDVYNQILAEDPSIPKIQSPMVNSSVLSVLHNNRHYHSHIHENLCSPLNHQLKPITTSKILSMIGRERATVACKEFSTILLEMYGQGSKASTSKPTKEVFIVDMKTHFRLMEQLVENESIILHHVLSCLPQVPGLLNKSQLKEGKEGVPRLIGQVKKKMGEFYHDILWRNVGQLAEETLLWDGGKERNPVGLIHPRVSLAFNTLLKEHLSAQFGDGYPSLILPAVHIIIETFSIHAVSASWDLQVLRSLALSIRPKPQRVLQDDLSLATLAGSYFKKTINSLVHFNNLCLPDIMNDIVSHGVHDPEEFPFLEELHVLRRLKATLYTVQNWVESRSAEYIQSWRVGDFFIINHADLARIYPSFDLLQICGHDRVAASNSTSIKLFTHVQQAIALQIYTVQQKIKNLPEEENENMCRVCRTFSLACLQNVFPPQKHWNK
ncbi:uncharacterized protein LOC111713966 [Eurytemora carolleeae]|uniref:uncharacterized protein LOC111713966 n=1 Tax=Eurytemora carolleeae TaxID=1294199 RepID=UPI000C767E55|nr:uncharacterized protein LOC111713966 [Eurytemora carolleeae]|eukprot:XP_023344731.1 uncharacterized protein LOC111713966 [Eurytemora affinis]